MKSFDYAAPATLAEATELLASASGTARVLAGGTDLIVQLREHLRDADLVVDVKKVPELMAMTYSPEGGLRLGASVPCHRIYDDPEVALAYPALADAARIVGGWQIQTRASVGGNLCNASPAGDTIPPLIAHGARCVVAGPGGTREIPAEDFCVAPGRNALNKGELLVTILLPAPATRSGSAYERFIPRNEMDIAVAGAASWVRLDPSGETIVEARIALAAVAPRPVLATEASDWLAGQPIGEKTYAHAGELARRVATPIRDMRGTVPFRTHLAGVLTQRTLAAAVARAKA
ncbi:MAG: xanthine dehydrogenase family protein subunit M [Isosphaeraceae bacterium]